MLTCLFCFSADQEGNNIADNSHSGGPATSTQTLVGSQVFGQNQHITNSDNVQASQNAQNEQQNIDDNTAGGTAPTTQAIFGANQKLGQTQTVSRSSGSNTQDSATNTMQNLTDSKTRVLMIVKQYRISLNQYSTHKQ